ncbi:type II toxin-antitoxin system VapC family toxin [Tsukamurella pseudospumae]|uniref:Ribonuclease VapC n=1 Tax=Tsukamurella pseudospumae TaxID=239498 RepID=A0A137ZHY9_9ACTN|nr:type II toxin-antitoxin system VapC family toxin [Tsukamurella pseudospumae]KXO97811.1 hypothetical protein AXK61_21605 [Tsukamurella pseudospumae]
MTQVLDSSVVVAAFIDLGDDGDWALSMLEDGPIVAPQLMPFEAANIIRRTLSRGEIDEVTARQALGRLHRLAVTTYVSFAAVADRAWELRANVTTYDASYVAVAEAFDCRLATLDHRLARATGPRCEIVTPTGR